MKFQPAVYFNHQSRAAIAFARGPKWVHYISMDNAEIRVHRAPSESTGPKELEGYVHKSVGFFDLYHEANYPLLKAVEVYLACDHMPKTQRAVEILTALRDSTRIDPESIPDEEDQSGVVQPQPTNEGTNMATKKKAKSTKKEMLKKKSAAKKSAEKKAPVKKDGPKKPSYRDILIQIFSKKNGYTADEIAEHAGTSKSNILVTIGILKNPSRTKAENLVVIERGEDGLYHRVK